MSHHDPALSSESESRDDAIFLGESFPQERESRVGMQICSLKDRDSRNIFKMKWNNSMSSKN